MSFYVDSEEQYILHSINLSSIFTPMPAYSRQNRLRDLQRKSVMFFPVLLFFLFLFAPKNASATSHCNIDDTYHTAWSETVGWIDFKPDATNCANVEDTKVTGWAWSDFGGWISLNCETDGSGCSTSYGVVNDGNGNLSGAAWSESLGWLDFAPPPGPERVIIQPNGEFAGYAWGENFGWISFNCKQPISQGGGDTCASVNYKVKSSWVPNSQPDKPLNLAPPDATPLETTVGITPTLKASPFDDPNPLDTHQATEWQLSVDPTLDFGTGAFTTSPITITDPDVNKIEHQIASGVLSYGTRYYWHVRYEDDTNLWSLWSDVWSFTTPLSVPQNIVCSGSDVAYTVTCMWNVVLNATGYEVYLKEFDSTFWPNGIANSSSFVVTNHHANFGALPLASNDSYSIKVKATRADSSYADSALSNSSVPAFLGVRCPFPDMGVLCRKGEVCGQFNINSTLKWICTNFDNCAVQGALPAGQTCYISACPSGIVQPDGSCYNSSPAGRVFNDGLTLGYCKNKASVYQCDLLQVLPKAPFVCKSDDTVCQDNNVAVMNVPYQPRLKWKDSDPPESFNDYRGIALSYPGDPIQYEVTLTETAPALPAIVYTFANSADLALGMGVDRFLNFANLISGAQYLDFNASYLWTVKAVNPVDGSEISGGPWNFSTESVCPYIFHDYDPPLYKDESLYPAPGNTSDNENVMYPLDATLSWGFPSLPADAIEGAGAGDKPTFVLHVQESDNGTLWTPAFPAQDVGVATEFRFGGSSANCADDPGTCLKSDKYYKWYLEVNHGHNPDPALPINTVCDTDNAEKNADIHYFISETTPAITLSKKLISIRESELTYQIDFSFTGAPWGRIKDFQVRDNYPDSVKTDFFDTKNSFVTDDTLKTKEPNTLKVTRLCEAQSGSNKTALIWGIGDSADPNCANVNANCTVSTDCSVSVKSKGSFILVINEQTDEPVPQCTLLTNQSTAKAEALNGTVLSVASNSVSHLAGSGQNDAGFVVTGRGDIHSNADICFKNFPDVSNGFYVGDYFITAKGVVDNILIPRSGPQYVFSDNPILELDRNPSAPDFAKIDYTNVYSEVLKTGGMEKRGECSASQIFGSESAMPVIQLNGNVYSCRSGEAGAIDYNGDGSAVNGDFVVDREMEIKTDGGSGTIVVDGNLYINADIFYGSGAPSSIKSIAALGWIVRGSVYITGYPIDESADCTDPSSDPRPKKWCDEYQVLESLDNGPDGLPNTEDDIYSLKYPAITLGPNQISGTFFAEQKIFTGKINNPLTINGSLIADEVVLERRIVDDGG